MSAPKPAYERVLLKLSGESLLGRRDYGIDIDTAAAVAQEIKEVHALGAQIGIMIGGGNIFRGVRGTAAAGFGFVGMPGFAPAGVVETFCPDWIGVGFTVDCGSL